MKINPFAGARDPDDRTAAIAALSKAADKAGQATDAARRDHQSKATDLELAQNRHIGAQDAWDKAYDGRASDTAKATAAASLAACAKDVAGCEHALARAAENLAQLETDATAAGEKVIRAKTAAYIRLRRTVLSDILDRAIGIMGELNAEAELDCEIDAQFRGLQVVAAGLAAEFPINKAQGTELLESRAHATEIGNAPPTVAHAKPALVAAQPDRPAVTQVFTIRKIRWHETGPGWRTAHAFVDIQLPVTVAERAIELGAALQPTDPKAKPLRANMQAVYPPPHSDHCETVDPEGFIPPVGIPEPRGATHSKFTPLDRGPAYKVPVKSAPMAAARSDTSTKDGDENV